MVAADLLSYAALGSLVGVVVGAVEILPRYSDAPFRPLFSGWGIGYIATERGPVVWYRHSALRGAAGRSTAKLQPRRGLPATGTNGPLVHP